MAAVTEPLPDASAVAGAAGQSLAAVAEAHLDTVLGYLAHLVRDRDLAEELTAETFARACAGWRRFDPARGSAVAWLCTLARSVALDHFRAERRRRGREARYAAETPEAVEATGLDAALGLSPGLARALGRLSRAEREVVALRVVLELDGAEAARVLGVSASACSSLLHRAMGKLREEMADERA